MNKHDNQQLRVASFFSGIGGFDLAFEQAGCEVVFQCEINSFCRKVLKKHWPNTPLVEDICEIKYENIPQAEIWCAGFPCQDLSLANQGKRKGLEGERSGLFAEFARLVRPVRPRWIVIENVPGLLNSNNGQDFKYVLETLDDLGYFVGWRVFDAKYFGTPQRRRRIFIVASYQTDCAARVLFERGSPKEVVGTSQIPDGYITGPSGVGIQDSNLFAIQHATVGRKPEAGPQAKGYRNDGETYTLDSRGSTDVVCETNVGFGVRDSSRFSRELDSNRARALGNAVCVYVARWIAQRIVAVEQESQPKDERQIKYASVYR